MTFYQELQLSSAGSKQLIKNTTDKKEKWRHILIYNFKVYLVMAFCVAVVTGQENSVVGVTVLLALLVLRQADFGIQTSHGLLSIVGIFIIMMAGPRLANMVSPVGAFFINCVCILLLMIFGCHNVIMHNHSTFVLGYLLLYGYLKLTLIVSSAMLIVSLLGLPRAMWAGIACMSVCLPFTEDGKMRAVDRGVFNIAGCALFLVLYLILPESGRSMIGIIGGIGVGYYAGYKWQTVFNTFGALAIAASLFGLPMALLLRSGINVIASLYTVVCNVIYDKLHGKNTEIAENLVKP